jgi:hypothetical protein
MGVIIDSSDIKANDYELICIILGRRFGNLQLGDRLTKHEVYRRRRLIGTLISGIFILFIAWSVLLYGFPPGMEPGAALLLITPFAMFIILAQTLEYLLLISRKSNKQT